MFEKERRMVGMRLLRRRDWYRSSKVECLVEGQRGFVGYARNE